MISLAAASAMLALVSANAQGGAPAKAPANAQVAANAQASARSAADLFASKCALCHQKGGWGTRALAKRVPPEQAELLNREALPADYVKYVVRRGIGSMPQFTPTDLSNEELDRLAAWIEKRP